MVARPAASSTRPRFKMPPEVQAEFEAWLDDYVTALVAGLDDHFDIDSASRDTGRTAKSPKRSSR
jgi:hypothetical protein